MLLYPGIRALEGIPAVFIRVRCIVHVFAKTGCRPINCFAAGWDNQHHQQQKIMHLFRHIFFLFNETSSKTPPSIYNECHPLGCYLI